MISLQNVNKYFNYKKRNEIHVINDTSLELPDTGLVAFLGPSGCGKTTLLNAIGGLDKVKKGKIFVNGQRITKRSSKYVDKMRTLNIGYIFQNYYLLDNLTVFENVAMSLKMTGIKNKGEITKRVNYVLETLGIYRYRNRLAGMLSGGERQRVGIARAIVKDPSIIIADEPTGNLDSANTIEIMNIIKSISKNRLVILVTHEVPLAKFYADRIVEIEDGKVQNDYINEASDDLDYRIENEFYLKDFEHVTNFENEDNIVNIYNDRKNDIKLTVVVKGNNIYIKSNNKGNKIEVVDDDSNIKFINEHYKKIDKSVYEKYDFNFSEIITKNEKPKYSSILKPFTILFNGLKRVFGYSFLKKLLLIGFLGSGLFVAYSISNMFGITNIKKEYFVEVNPDYYTVDMLGISPETFEKYESIKSVDYMLPRKSIVNFKSSYADFYQTMNAADLISGSITSDINLKKSDLYLGRLPENDYEIVVDKMVIDKILDNSYSSAVQSGYGNVKRFLNKEVTLKNMDPFTIVGISNLESPSIYAKENMLINIVANSQSEDSIYESDYEYDYFDDSSNYLDYTLVSDLKITKGRLPENNYEVVINESISYEAEVGKTLDKKINDQKLTVVGYYTSEKVKDNSYLVNENTIKINLIKTGKKISIYPSDKKNIESDFENEKIKITNTYEESLKAYKKSRKSSVRTGLIFGAIILAISLIEIFFMVRASFLSRIKETGIMRAIGVKKSDIYKMFYAEIVGITTIACVPGILFMSYCLSVLKTISYFEENYLVNPFTIILSIGIVYVFNIIIGLIPVIKLVRHTPAEILARKDLD